MMTVYRLIFARCALNDKKNSHNNGVPAIFFRKEIVIRIIFKSERQQTTTLVS